MTKDALFTLEELAQVGGVSPRTIRYYTSEGLLPPPTSRGRFALYGLAHRNRLRLITLLKQSLLPLATMRAHVPGLTDTHVAALLARQGAVGSVLERAAGEEPFPLEKQAVGTPVGEQAESYRYLEGVLTTRAQTPLSDTSEQNASEQTPAPRKPRRALFMSNRIQENSAEEPIANQLSTIDNPDTWQRVLLAPGVELHVRLPDSPHARQQLDQLIAETKSLFES